MRLILLLLIRCYQKHLSPRKGFCCAYRYHTGHASCSSLGYRVIRRFGVLAGLLLLKQRFRRCTLARQRYGAGRVYLRPPRAQRGDCDCGISACDCNPFDGIGGDSVCDNNGRSSGACQNINCCDACDFFERDEKKEKRKKSRRGVRYDEMYLPPKKSL